MCTRVSLYVCSQKPEEDPRAGIPGISGLPGVGAGNQTSVPCFGEFFFLFLLFFFFLFLSVCLFLKTVSLCSPICPGTCSVPQACLKLPHALAFV